MRQLAAQIADSAAAIRNQWDRSPRVGIILGTGLGNLAEEIEPDAIMGYDQIPHFPTSTAIGHKGQLVCGMLAGLPVVTMEGRFHAYEGYSPAQITLPVRVMDALGIELLIVSNACGALNPKYAVGDIMLIEDHINLMGDNPLIGINDESLGPRFPDMSQSYDLELIRGALQIARRENFVAHRGVYVALTGPNYETRAEYRLLRRIGGDVVGMSTVPEVIVAAQMGLKVLALSTITNVCLPDALKPVDEKQIVAAAESAEQKVRKIVLGILKTEAVRGTKPVNGGSRVPR